MAKNQNRPEQKLKMRKRSPYGFRYNVHRKGTEIGIRWEWLEKYIGRSYEIIAINLVWTFLATAALGIGVFIYLITNPLRALYMSAGLIILLVAIIGFLLMQTLSDLSAGSLIQQARVLSDFKRRKKNIDKGKEEPLLDTGDGFVDEEGYVHLKSGEIGRLILIDGLTNPSNFPEESKAQEETAITWQRARPRNAYEVKISTVQPQNTKRQVRELHRRGRLSERNSVKALVKQQANYLEKRVEGVIPTTVQYIFVVAKDKRLLDTYLELMDNCVDIGLYYGATKQNKEQTEELLTEIRQFL